ncbi:MAG: hypothetical protein HYV63_00700 [Candidatus Schekmanbacteria bacterium]|nr:hypothetical protein [Candidatus Schekmanbacteria bacterium]
MGLLRAMVAEMSEAKTLSQAEELRSSRIVVVDATTVQAPGAKGPIADSTSLSTS